MQCVPERDTSSRLPASVTLTNSRASLIVKSASAEALRFASPDRASAASRSGSPRESFPTSPSLLKSSYLPSSTSKLNVQSYFAGTPRFASPGRVVLASRSSLASRSGSLASLATSENGGSCVGSRANSVVEVASPRKGRSGRSAATNGAVPLENMPLDSASLMKKLALEQVACASARVETNILRLENQELKDQLAQQRELIQSELPSREALIEIASLREREFVLEVKHEHADARANLFEDLASRSRLAELMAVRQYSEYAQNITMDREEIRAYREYNEQLESQLLETTQCLDAARTELEEVQRNGNPLECQDKARWVTRADAAAYLQEEYARQVSYLKDECARDFADMQEECVRLRNIHEDQIRQITSYSEEEQVCCQRLKAELSEAEHDMQSFRQSLVARQKLLAAAAGLQASAMGALRDAEQREIILSSELRAALEDLQKGRSCDPELNLTSSIFTGTGANLG